MSILIKGMEMPTSCSKCPFEHMTMRYCNVIKQSTSHYSTGKEIRTPRHKDCPLVEVDDNEIDEANKALKGVREASRIITEVFCRPTEVETNE